MSISDPNPEDLNVDADQIEATSLEGELEKSYIEYAMSVIVQRALPDVRDGLKPVQRRILYAMDQQGLSSSGSHRKSSSVIGETMGNYHPHGDSSIYDALVRMAQDFSLRTTLVDGQGNFGSIDGDPAAAMRYTEARLSPRGELLLDDIEKNTVDFSDNYDGRMQEPDVLPSAFPNLLINGVEGIAVGLSTKIPPHNPKEVIDATIHYIDNPESDVDDLMEHINGPDFPTGGKVVGTESMEKAYRTGRGRLTVRGDYHFEEQESGGTHMVITEIPFQDRSRKQDLVEDIANLVKDGKIEGIRTIRDESDDGIRIVLEIKNSAVPEVVANKVVSTVLERTFGVTMIALVDGEPRLLSLPEIISEFVDHRREVVRRRSEEELEEAEDRAHILEGRLKALQNVEDVVELIRDADERSDARSDLREQYDFSEEQAAHIVRMQLGSLTSMEKQDIRDEYDNLTDEIERLEEILNSKDVLDEVVKEELREITSEFDNERKTEIVPESEASSMTRTDFIVEEDQVVVQTETGYFKRMSADELTEYSRGSKGLSGVNLRDEDNLQTVRIANTHDTMYFVTDSGRIYSKPAHRIPEQSRKARGKPAVNFLDLNDDETITSMFAKDELDEDCYLTFVTKNGVVKRTRTSEYDNIQKPGISALDLGDDDEVVDVFETCEGDTLILTTQKGQAIRFDVEDVRVTGRTTHGVGGIEFKDSNTGDEVVAANRIQSDDDLVFTITENGYGKATAAEEYRVQSRKGTGVKAMDMCERNGDIVDAFTVTPEAVEQSRFLIGTDTGRVLRAPAEEVSVVGRLTKGVKMIEADGDSVVDATIGIFEETGDDE